MRLKNHNGNFYNTYEVTFKSKAKESFYALVTSDRKRDSLLSAVGLNPGFFDPDELLGRVVSAKHFINKHEDGTTSDNIDYFTYSPNFNLMIDFFEIPSPHWNKQQIQKYLNRWRYIDFLEDIFDFEMYEWILAKQKLSDEHGFIYDIKNVDQSSTSQTSES